MDRQRPDLELLNAYVDGELCATDAAEVARRVAEDPAIARQVAALTRLRSVLPAAIEVPPMDLPRVARRPAIRARLAIAASLALLFATLSATAYYWHDRDSEPRWLALAMTAHQAWHLPAIGRRAAGGDILLQAADQSAQPLRAYVPDLSTSKLTVVFVDANHTFFDQPAIVVGYAGSRGCKLTLVASPADPKEDGAFHFLEKAGNSAYSWRTGGLEYLLMAKGMDRARFDLIAKSVYRATAEHAPFDRDTRIALHDSRAKSRPCAA